MSEPEEPGLLEHTRVAVQPLTNTGEFLFSKLEYGNRHGGVHIHLSSRDLDIKFHFKLKAPDTVDCYFITKPAKKIFIAKYFFPAKKIEVSLGRCNTSKTLEYPLLRKMMNSHQEIIGAFLAQTEFIPELNRLCVAINKHLPEIKEALSPKRIDETIRLYEIISKQQY